ncbi:OB-fold domain-containing protein [Streptomyces sp. NPDC005483]|uniref:Zn-ribbon domain-containing OB-fold protein n=1 Tax=Streptomyces sp. NPDC005483 TaxID=3154882 RepID=UPI0033ADBF63
MTTRLIDESLFENPENRDKREKPEYDSGDAPRLVGARCSGCSTVVFPRQDSCPRCAHGTMSAHVLPVSGRVWSWTLQAFPPKPPYRPPAGGHRPYHLGYVDLGEVLVEARLAVPREEIRIGLPVRLTTVTAYEDEDGTEVITFAFRPERDDER